MSIQEAGNEKELVEKLRKERATGTPVRALLRTDERVLARISDGIYRLPSSAIRELIANAYDADARTVTVVTDRPRFREISIRDDGRGMSLETLSRMIHHIGGSAKRTKAGSRLGIADPYDPLKSTGGRRLIGKIGIGLFSVAQLTRHFLIVTKQAGERYRLLADVKLHTYSEDDLVSRDDNDSDDVITGSVEIRSLPADDPQTHGTEITLLNIQPAAVDVLRSAETWERVLDTEEIEEHDAIHPPAYHAGHVNPQHKDDSDLYDVRPNLPWKHEDEPEEKFRKLHSAVMDLYGRSNARPKLAESLDEYLQLIWNIGLSLPTKYLGGKHPFDLQKSDDPLFFVLSNNARGRAEELQLADKESVRAAVGLEAPYAPDADQFEILVDGVKVFRPIIFNGLVGADTEDLRRQPLVFVGRFSPSLDHLPDRVVGGRELYFEAYFRWSPNVVPTEHAGVLVRIADTSGALFDPSFFGYQVRELRRLSQITAEVFVRKGLDAALNIDRESFNFGHPHAKIVSSWVHRALRQVATTQKRLAKEARDDERSKRATEVTTKLEKTVVEAVDYAARKLPKKVQVFEQLEEMDVKTHRAAGEVVLSSDVIEPALVEGGGVQQRRRSEMRREQMIGIIQILDAYGLLDDLPYDRQESLFRAIAEVLGAEE